MSHRGLSDAVQLDGSASRIATSARDSTHPAGACAGRLSSRLSCHRGEVGSPVGHWLTRLPPVFLTELALATLLHLAQIAGEKYSAAGGKSDGQARPSHTRGSRLGCSLDESNSLRPRMRVLP
ncbi:hypothetical protein SNK04_014282 [Fusarium graminearum]